MNDFNLFLSLVQEVQRKDRELDTTPSLRLLFDETASKVKNILKKLADNNNIQINHSDNCFLLEARYQIQKKLRQQVTMCKAIPVGEINKYLSFDYDIGNFMVRKADLMT